MQFIRKFLAVILIIILFPLLVINILVFSINSTILDPVYLENKFSSNHVYENIIDLGLPLLASGVGENSELGNVIKSDDLVKIAQKSITADSIENEFNKIFSGFNKYLKNQTNDLEINIDLESIKNSFSTNFTEYINQNIANLPACNQAELKQMENNQAALKCLPPGISKNDLVKNNNQNIELLNSLPNEYNLGELISKTSGPQLEMIKRVLDYIDLGLLILTAANVLILILIGLIIWKPITSLIKWLATAIIIPSGIMFLGSTFGYLFSKIFSPTMSLGLVLPVEARAILNNLVFNVIGPMQIRMIVTFGLLTLIAIIGYIIVKIINKRTVKSSSL